MTSTLFYSKDYINWKIITQIIIGVINKGSEKIMDPL